MGFILSKFRKKVSTLEILTKIDEDITSIEEYKLHTQQRQKKIIGRLIIYSIVLYVIVAIVFYFYYFPSTFKEQLLYITPLLVFPILVYLLKRFLTWYYRRMIRKNESKLSKLKTEKEKILEDVMEKDTYKVAKEILEKFAPEQLRKTILNKSPQDASNPSNSALPSSEIATGVRRRVISQQPKKGEPLVPPTPWSVATSPGLLGPSRVVNMTQKEAHGHVSPGTRLPSNQQSPVLQPNVNGRRIATRPPGPPMPRPVLPRERPYLDRLIEYLVADGPSNRYALICRQCESHNGMALKEEFEYLAFRCCYCYYWNPARKQRPQAPRLPIVPPADVRRQSGDSTSEEEEEGEGSDQSRDSGSESARDVDEKREGIEAEDKDGSAEISGSDVHTETKEKSDSKDDVDSANGMGDSLADTGSQSEQADDCNIGTGSKNSSDGKEEESDAEDLTEDKQKKTED